MSGDGSVEQTDGVGPGDGDATGSIPANASSVPTSCESGGHTKRPASSPGSLAITSIGLGVFCVSSMAYLNECVPDSSKGAVSGSYYFAWGLGYFAGPLAIGHLGEMTDLQVGYYGLAVLLIAVAGLLCLGRSGSRHT